MKRPALLRDYQAAAVQSIVSYVARNSRPALCVMPTGSGKSHVLNAVVDHYDVKTVVLCPTKEIVLQNAAKIRKPYGVCCAALNERDTSKPVTVATIQSVYKDKTIKPQLIIVDECHLIKNDDDGMYRAFLKNNPDATVAGFTATPFRGSGDPIFGARSESVFNEVCFRVTAKELIAGGWLCGIKPVSASEITAKEWTQLPQNSSFEYDGGWLDSVFTTRSRLECLAGVLKKNKSKRTIVFVPSIAVADKVKKFLISRGLTAERVHSEVGELFVNETIESFRSGELPVIIAVSMLVVGFDVPEVDCIVLFRATKSPVLYYQMCGRGMRRSREKKECLLYDFGENVKRFGPPDIEFSGETDCYSICNSCMGYYHNAKDATCPHCGSVKFVVEPKESVRQFEPSRNYNVVDIDVSCYTSKKSGNTTLRISYATDTDREYHQYLCFDHPRGGYAQKKAAQWWRRASNELVPVSVDHAYEMILDGKILMPRQIVVKKNGDYDNVEDVIFGRDFFKQKNSWEKLNSDVEDFLNDVFHDDDLKNKASDYRTVFFNGDDYVPF